MIEIKFTVTTEVTGQVAPKVIAPEVMSPETRVTSPQFIVMSPEMTSGDVTYGQMTFGRLDHKPPKKFRTGEKSMGGGEQGSSSESAACERTRRGISSLK